MLGLHEKIPGSKIGMCLNIKLYIQLLSLFLAISLLPLTYPNLLCSGKLRGWKRFSKYVTRSATFADLILSDNEDDNDNNNDGDDNDTLLLNEYCI
jgi:hypothetical protein